MQEDNKIWSRSLHKRNFLCDGVDFHDPCPSSTKTIIPLNDYARDYLATHPTGTGTVNLSPTNVTLGISGTPSSTQSGTPKPVASGEQKPGRKGTKWMECYT
ncbi:MAG: hypothetical protein M1814_002210 [Vezdaea aestivalis]|nr:MAG: hypothetical protein M1814_002210 [Vezdaea aestivalis]